MLTEKTEYIFCYKCRTNKPILEYSRNRSTSSGYNSWCRTCMKEYRKFRSLDKSKNNIEPKTLICSNCKESKPIENFHRNRYSLSGRNAYCNTCRSELGKERRLNESSEVREGRLKRLRESNYRRRPAQRIYEKSRREKDIGYRLTHSLRARLNTCIRRSPKSGSAVRDLGCSVEQFKVYLESRFQPGMSWSNYGKVWNLDHILPISSFDLSIREELLRACHYTNIQPMFVEDNRRKSNKLIIEEVNNYAN